MFKNRIFAKDKAGEAKKTELDNTDKKREFPEAVVGGLIIDDNENILLAKNRKWEGRYTIFGGHVEKGETLKEAILRELKEESGLEVEVIAELGFGESVFHEHFNNEKHFIFIDFLCKYDGKHEDVNLDSREYQGGEFIWVPIEEAKKMEIADGTMQIIERYEKYLKNQEYLNRWKRCQADFENYRKRQDESKKEFQEFVLADLATQILPVVDNFQMSLDHVPEDQGKSPWLEGILHIQRQLETILKENGITEIEVKEGDEFDPNIHEAVANEMSEGPVKSSEAGPSKMVFNRVKKVISRGYKIGDKIIRAAKVIVE